MTQEECPFRSSRVLHDDKGEFHLCNIEGGDCECIPSGCPYLIAKNSKLNLPDLPGYVQIDNKEGEKSKIPTSLEEAADERARKIYPYEGGTKGLICENAIPIYTAGFIAGAECQKEQMLKDAVEGEVIYDLGGFFRIKSEAIDGAKYKVGSWVKLIIVKED